LRSLSRSSPAGLEKLGTPVTPCAEIPLCTAGGACPVPLAPVVVPGTLTLLASGFAVHRALAELDPTFLRLRPFSSYFRPSCRFCTLFLSRRPSAPLRSLPPLAHRHQAAEAATPATPVARDGWGCRLSNDGLDDRRRKEGRS
jgi:hypothetical protein